MLIPSPRTKAVKYQRLDGEIVPTTTSAIWWTIEIENWIMYFRLRMNRAPFTDQNQHVQVIQSMQSRKMPTSSGTVAIEMWSKFQAIWVTPKQSQTDNCSNWVSIFALGAYGIPLPCITRKQADISRSNRITAWFRGVFCTFVGEIHIFDNQLPRNHLPSFNFQETCEIEQVRFFTSCKCQANGHPGPGELVIPAWGMGY